MAVTMSGMAKIALLGFAVTWMINGGLGDMRCGRKGLCICQNTYDITTDTDLIRATCPLDTNDLSWPAFAGRIRSWIKLHIDLQEQKFTAREVRKLVTTIDDLQGYYGKITVQGRYACEFVRSLNSADLICQEQEDHVVSPIHINCHFGQPAKNREN